MDAIDAVQTSQGMVVQVAEQAPRAEEEERHTAVVRLGPAASCPHNCGMDAADWTASQHEEVPAPQTLGFCSHQFRIRLQRDSHEHAKGFEKTST